MTFDGLLAQHDRRGDLAVTLGERHQTQDFYLAPGQTAKGAPGEATCRIRTRGRLIAGEREGDGLVQCQRAPLSLSDRGGSLAETPRGNLEPSVESLTARWKRDGPDRLAQSARGFSQADGAPGSGHRQRPGETFDAVRGRQVVPGLAGQTKALGKRCAGAPGVALG